MRVPIPFSLIALLAMTLLGINSTSAQQRGRGAFGLGASANLATIAANEAVQKDQGLSADVSGKLRELRDDYLAAVQKENQNAGVNSQGLQDLPDAARREMVAKAAKVAFVLQGEFNPKVKALVSADQYKRLEQIQLQSNLRNQGPAALTDMSFSSRAELKLTDEQIKKLNDLTAEFGPRQHEVFTGGFNQEAFSKLREERTAKTMEVLTAEQKETLNKLKGPEFDVSQLGLGGRGQRGNN